MTYPRPLNIECPRCHALPGQPCRSPIGRRSAPHSQRAANPPPTGRRNRLNPQIIEAVCNDVAQGVPVTHAAVANGIGASTLLNWLALSTIEDEAHAPHRELRERLEHARAEAVVKHVGLVNRAAEGGYVRKKLTRTFGDGTQEEELTYADLEWRASAFLLERLFPREFGRRQVVELAHAEGLVPGQDDAGVLDSAGLDRVFDRLRMFAEARREQRQVGSGDGVVEGEVVE